MSPDARTNIHDVTTMIIRNEFYLQRVLADGMLEAAAVPTATSETTGSVLTCTSLLAWFLHSRDTILTHTCACVCLSGVRAMHSRDEHNVCACVCV